MVAYEKGKMRMDQKRITTALNPAVGAAAEQSSLNMYAQSIANPSPEINENTSDYIGFCTDNSISGKTEDKVETDWYDDPDQEFTLRIIRRTADPSYLPTISMTQLYDQVYCAKPPLIENLLYPGTYLFVGAPKLGKSFLMLQIAYHVAAGLPLWEYPVRQSSVLYLALEDDPRRLQERLYRMFGTECTDRLHMATRADYKAKRKHTKRDKVVFLCVKAKSSKKSYMILTPWRHGCGIIMRIYMSTVTVM